MASKYRARNDAVFARLVRPGEVNGLVLPDRSVEGNWWQVEAVGPLVKDLTPGMQVVVGASPGAGLIFPVPGEKDLWVIDQKHVLAIVETRHGPA